MALIDWLERQPHDRSIRIGTDRGSAFIFIGPVWQFFRDFDYSDGIVFRDQHLIVPFRRIITPPVMEYLPFDTLTYYPDNSIIARWDNGRIRTAGSNPGLKNSRTMIIKSNRGFVIQRLRVDVTDCQKAQATKPLKQLAKSFYDREVVEEYDSELFGHTVIITGSEVGDFWTRYEYTGDKADEIPLPKLDADDCSKVLIAVARDALGEIGTAYDLVNKLGKSEYYNCYRKEHAFRVGSNILISYLSGRDRMIAELRREHKISNAYLEYVKGIEKT